MTSPAPRAGEIPLAVARNCDRENATYVLTRDIRSPVSALFAAKGGTIDLNGHVLTYAAGYRGVTNCSFEAGLGGWDVSRE